MYSTNEATLPWLSKVIARLPGQRKSARAQVLCYGFALVMIAVAYISRELIGPPDVGLPLLTFFTAAALTTIIAGIGPGLFAAVIGMTIGTYLYMPPYHAFSFDFASGNVLSNVVFMFDEIIVCLALKAMQIHHEKSRANQELLKSIVEGTTDAIYVKDVQGNYLFYNSAAAHLFGRSTAEVMGSNDGALYPVDEAQALVEQDRAVVTAHCVMDFENHISTSAGEKRYFLSTKGPLHNPQGRIIGTFGIDRDITAKRHAEEQTHLAARVFDMTTEGIVVTDAKNKILTINNAFVALTGYSHEEAIGMTPRLLQSGRHAPEFYAAMWQELKTRGRWDGEIWNRRKNGDIFLEWLSINAVRDVSGQVANYVGVFRDITVVREAQERMDYLATHDELTTLPNRTLLIDRLRLAVNRASRADNRLALLFVDIDNFKLINDTLGHDLGDKLLLQAADRLKACVRGEDTVARMGGDEFVVLLEGSDRDTVTHCAERMLTMLSRHYKIGDQECFASASIGISIYPDDAIDPVDLLRHADAAMYRAKEEGKNGFQFFNGEMAERSKNRLDIERGLRHAIQNGELFLEYQPQINLENEQLIGVEALIRWRQGDRIISPMDFIPVAEESSLIIDIGEWVVGEACRQLQLWDESGCAPFTVSVNISARHFLQTDMVERISSIVRRAGIEPRRICLEITEGAMANVNTTMTMLTELAAFGFETSVDDFGTGFSSLSHLKRFPLHELKVDRSFVNGIVDDRDDHAITSAIIAMASSLDLRVVAEGIETHEQLQKLRDMGCQIGQGYLFSKPLPVDRFSDWLTSRNVTIE